ncbi:MAG: hypothetical protein ACRDGM_00825 [bacterium]
MTKPKVFFVHLRRPKSNPDERRDDPFYELGSFGCTGCHSTTLFRPHHAADLNGARLAFIQGGPLGARLVFVTPPITVKVWKDRCEARWAPAEMPFKYTEAPMLASNHAGGDFPLVEEFARNTRRTTVEGGLSSKLRSRVTPLSAETASEVIAVYERCREQAPTSAIATTYDAALPWRPPKVDRNRTSTYDSHIRKLKSQVQSRCCSSRRR